MSVEMTPFTAADIPEVYDLWSRSQSMGLFGDSPERIAACLERHREGARGALPRRTARDRDPALPTCS